MKKKYELYPFVALNRTITDYLSQAVLQQQALTGRTEACSFTQHCTLEGHEPNLDENPASSLVTARLAYRLPFCYRT
jgi:hypothetical protein